MESGWAGDILCVTGWQADGGGGKLGADAVVPLAPRELFKLNVDNSASISPYAVAPDGKRFLVSALQSGGGESLEVIVNWSTLLRKGAER